MAEQGGHITFKIILGYLLIITIAVFSVFYIYQIIEEMAFEEEPDNQSNLKVYLITNTLSLIYESETLGQLVNDSRQDYNRTLNKAIQNMDSLRTLITDEEQLLKIDTIHNLIEQKRRNTGRLLQTWRETSTETLYTRNIERFITTQDTVMERIEVQERLEVVQDSVLVPGRRRNFFQRLSDVFSPSGADSSIIVNTTTHIVTDTLVVPYNPSENIVTVLRNIQDSVADQRREMSGVLLNRLANLQYNNSIITSKINQILRDIEEEEMNASYARIEKKQGILKDTSKLIGIIAITSVLIGLLFLVMIMRDISRSNFYRKQLEKAKSYAEELLNIREKLMLTISHDIRAPLSSIIGYIDLLTGLNPGERQNYYLKNMKGSSSHILSLVNNLLDFHRLESGKMEVKPVEFNLKDLFEEIYMSFKPIADAKDLDFDFVFNDNNNGLNYWVDPIRLRQITGNLLSNAIKFTPDGSVKLSVFLTTQSEEENKLVVIVSDTGPGMSEEEQAKIFEEFARLDGQEKTEGFGLGLSITCKMVELMGGSLTVHSTRGKGSDFKMTFEVKRADHANPGEAGEKSIQSQQLSDYADLNVSCLLVDDDPIQLVYTREFLEQMKVKVTCCSNSLSVYKLLEKKSFSLVITDIQMPYMDGYDLLRQIRESENENIRCLPVIALSANIDREMEHYQVSGFDSFLNKPFTIQQLSKTLNEVLDIELKPAPELNFNSITAFAGDDAESYITILRSFAEESGKNIERLEAAVQTASREEAAHLAHKMIPMLSMINAGDIVEMLRKIEKEKDLLSDTDWQSLVSTSIEKVKEIVSETDERIRACV